MVAAGDTPVGASRAPGVELASSEKRSQKSGGPEPMWLNEAPLKSIAVRDISGDRP